MLTNQRRCGAKGLDVKPTNQLPACKTLAPDWSESLSQSEGRLFCLGSSHWLTGIQVFFAELGAVRPHLLLDVTQEEPHRPIARLQVFQVSPSPVRHVT